MLLIVVSLVLQLIVLLAPLTERGRRILEVVVAVLLLLVLLGLGGILGDPPIKHLWR